MTLPLTMRTVLLVTLISVIGSLLAFDQFYLMTAGQPLNQTATSVFYVYLNSFPFLKLGYGAALSLILAVFILIFTVTQMILTRRSQHERRRCRTRATASTARDRIGRLTGVDAALAYLRRCGLRRALHGHGAAARRLGAGVGEADGGGRRRRRRRTSRTASASTPTGGCGTTRPGCRPT